LNGLRTLVIQISEESAEGIFTTDEYSILLQGLFTTEVVYILTTERQILLSWSVPDIILWSLCWRCQWTTMRVWIWGLASCAIPTKQLSGPLSVGLCFGRISGSHLDSALLARRADLLIVSPNSWSEGWYVVLFFRECALSSSLLSPANLPDQHCPMADCWASMFYF
jgi:hypothetical protein